MHFSRQSSPVSQSEFTLQKGEHRIGVGRRNSDGHPQNDSFQEETRLSAYECRDDRTVEGSDVEGEKGTEDEE